MSRYQNWLIEHITHNPIFIQPATRRNEVLGFLRQPLGDLCISRPVSRLNWGIPLPFASTYVTYVWFDALFNYISALGYLSQPNPPYFERFWPEAIHLIGKDILTTHCVYWPTMLQAVGLPLPKTILAHGWWVVEGEKMSKSRGNAIKPLDLAEIYGVDAFRYFLLRDMTLGRDANFSEAALRHRYENDLANALGNLLQRLVKMVGRYCEGQLPAPAQLTALDQALVDQASALGPQVFALAESFALNQVLAQIFEFVKAINTYLEQATPWREAKAQNISRVGTILYQALEGLRLAAVLLHPVLPERMTELWRRLGWQPTTVECDLAWGGLQTGTEIGSGEVLFPKR